MPSPLSSQQTTRIRMFSVLRELVSTYDAFYQVGSAQVEQFGLSIEQFDVIATLGNTPGMSLVELGNKMLLKQNALLAVLDALEADRLIFRETPADKPMMIVKLTPAGEKIFAVTFPVHLEYLEKCFGQLDQAELDLLHIFLKRLKGAFTKNS
jgi:MarR family transcriptional regulator, 2-MHQ and catechol-resistance regulon repressor